MMIRLQALVRKELRTTVSPFEFYEYSTLGHMAMKVEKAVKAEMVN